jgi:hypothetical protein
MPENAKKDPYRFCIKLNALDPRQAMAANLLNGQGRGMAMYIANALLHYVHCDKEAQSADSQTLLLQAFEKLLDEKLKNLAVAEPRPEVKIAAGQNLSPQDGGLDAAAREGIKGALQGFLDG